MPDRPCNVPHPTGACVRDLTQETNERRKRRFAEESPAGRGTKLGRVQGPNGSWPAARSVERKRPIDQRDLAPRPPAICFLYEDLNDLEKLEAPLPVFGQYPAAFIPKILPWLRCQRHQVLHVFFAA